MTNLQKRFFQKCPTLSPCNVGNFWENQKNSSKLFVYTPKGTTMPNFIKI